MIGNLVPRLRYIDGPGEVGKVTGSFGIGKLVRFYVREHHYLPVASLPRRQTGQFNPFRDVAYGGTLIGWKGKNYWFLDETLVGLILRWIFA